MTSPIATNAEASGAELYGYETYLRAKFESKGTVPLFNQIGKTTEVLSLSNPSETGLVFDAGKDFYVVTADLGDGTMNIAVTDSQVRNLVGRTITILALPVDAGGANVLRITLPSAGPFFGYQGAAVPLVMNRVTMPVTVASVIQLHFTYNETTETPGPVIVSTSITGYTFAAA